MSYSKRLEEEIIHRLSKRPGKKAKIKHLKKLNKYHERMQTGK